MTSSAPWSAFFRDQGPSSTMSGAARRSTQAVTAVVQVEKENERNPLCCGSTRLYVGPKRQCCTVCTMTVRKVYLERGCKAMCLKHCDAAFRTLGRRGDMTLHCNHRSVIRYGNILAHCEWLSPCRRKGRPHWFSCKRAIPVSAPLVCALSNGQCG